MIQRQCEGAPGTRQALAEYAACCCACGCEFLVWWATVTMSARALYPHTFKKKKKKKVKVTAAWLCTRRGIVLYGWLQQQSRAPKVPFSHRSSLSSPLRVFSPHHSPSFPFFPLPPPLPHLCLAYSTGNKTSTVIKKCFCVVCEAVCWPQGFHISLPQLVVLSPSPPTFHIIPDFLLSFDPVPVDLRLT